MSGRWGRVSVTARASLHARVPHGRHAIVGLKLFHTVGDSERAVDQIDTEMNAIVDAMYRIMGVDPGIRRTDASPEFATLTREEKDAWKLRALDAIEKAKQSPWWSFWEQAVSPVFEEWQRFRWGQKFYNVFTSWEEYERWLERAKQLRASLQSKGVPLHSLEPMDLSKTLPGVIVDAAGDAARKAAEAAAEAGKIAKYALYAALGLGSLFGLSFIFQRFKGTATRHDL